MADRIAAVDRYIQEHVGDWMEELSALCRVPSVSARHEGVEECAELVASMLRGRGFAADVMASGGHPIVLAEAEGAADRTMLMYNHYDVQPPEPLELWKSPPFEPEIRDGAIYARGSKDDKGELIARLAALDALKAADGRYPCRVRWLVEGEEEVGSPNLPAFVAGHAERLRCDGAIWEEGGTDAQGNPEQTLGARGMLYVELSVRASARDGHSGLANVIPNAAWRLTWALASLKGPNEEVRIPGFTDGVVPMTDRQRELIAALPSPREALQQSFGLDRLLLGRTGVHAAVFEPTCNIAGITAGYQGPGAKTVIPALASAKVDFRLVPGQDPERIAGLLRAHLEAGGFGDVHVQVLGAERAGVVDPDDPLVQATAETAAEIYGRPSRLVPLTGGTTPMYLFTEQGVPVVAPGVGYGSGNLAHSPNEHMRLADFEKAARHLTRVLTRFSAF